VGRILHHLPATLVKILTLVHQLLTRVGQVICDFFSLAGVVFYECVRLTPVPSAVLPAAPIAAPTRRMLLGLPRLYRS